MLSPAIKLPALVILDAKKLFCHEPSLESFFCQVELTHEQAFRQSLDSLALLVLVVVFLQCLSTQQVKFPRVIARRSLQQLKIANTSKNVCSVIHLHVKMH